MFIKKEDGTFRERFFTKIGLPEGCTLSPLLFAAFISDLDLHTNNEGITLEVDNGTKIKIFYIAYADDLAIVCEDNTSLRRAIKIVENYGAVKSLTVNVSKQRF